MSPDPAQGDPFAPGLIESARRGDGPAIAEFLAGVDHPDDRSFYCSLVGEYAGDGAWIDNWAAADPHSATPLTVKGIHGVHWAWEARSARRARYVGPAAFATFFQRLDIAQVHLDRAAQLDRDDPTPLSWQVTLGRALELGIDETRRRFDEVRRRYPWHVFGHDQMLQALCEKWGGSHQMMHDFAQEAVAEAPGGSSLGYLVGIAHLEHWLALPDDQSTDYMRSEGTISSLNAAADRSVNHLDHRRGPGWPMAENTFAMAFSLSGRPSSAADRFRIIGDVVTATPWDYLGDAGTAFAQARAIALA